MKLLNIKVSIFILISSFCNVSAKKCITDSVIDPGCDTIYLQPSNLINKYFGKAVTNPNTKALYVTPCGYLTDISTLKNSNLRALRLFGLPSLVNIKPLMNLPTIESLSIGGISNMADLGVLYKLPKLNSLCLNNLPKLKNLNFLITQKKLYSLKLGLLDSLNDYSIIDSLPNLCELAFAIPKIKDYSIFKDLHNLKQLKIIELDTLDLTGMEVLNALEEIDLDVLYLKNSYLTIRSFSNLKKIRIVNCLAAGLGNLGFINKHLEKLILEGMDDLDTIKLSSLNIRNIYMSNMGNLKFLSLTNLPNLEHIMISDFRSLATFQLYNVPNLKRLTVFNMESLESFPNLISAPNLNILTIGNSKKIKISDENIQILSENDTLVNNCEIDSGLIEKVKNRHCIIKEWDNSEIENQNSLK